MCLGGSGLNVCSAVSYFSTLLGSIIGAGRLSFRVRDGTGRFPAAMAAVTLFTLFWVPPHVCGWGECVLVVECVDHFWLIRVRWCGCVVASAFVRQFFSYTVLSATPQGGVCVSFRPVSASSLNLLLGVQVWSIDPVVCGGPYPTEWVRSLVLEKVSRLDAFSGYPVRTWLSSRAPGGTTGGPEVRPSRSSRTRDRFPQASDARGG